MATADEGVAALSEQAKLFVGGFSRATSKEMLVEYFSEYGDVVDAVVVMDRATGISRGFGFVQFRDISSAERAFNREDHIINARKVDLRRFEVKENKKTDAGSAGSSSINTVSDDRKIFVGGLCPSITADELKIFFQRFGTVDDAVVVRDLQTGRSRRFGFVTFTSSEPVEEVMKTRFYFLKNKAVEVKKVNLGNSRSDIQESSSNGTVPHPLQDSSRNGNLVHLLPDMSSSLPVAYPHGWGSCDPSWYNPAFGMSPVYAVPAGFCRWYGEPYPFVVPTAGCYTQCIGGFAPVCMPSDCNGWYPAPPTISDIGCHATQYFPAVDWNHNGYFPIGSFAPAKLQETDENRST